MTEDDMSVGTTGTHDAVPAAKEADDDIHDSTTTTKSETKKESGDKKATAAEEKSAENADHDGTGEHYAVNATNTNGYPVAVGITLGALTAFGLALRYL